MTNSILSDLRREYHKQICDNILGFRSGTIVYSNADKDSPTSVELAEKIALKMGYSFCPNPPSGQAAGANFTLYTKNFCRKHSQNSIILGPAPGCFP